MKSYKAIITSVLTHISDENWKMYRSEKRSCRNRVPEISSWGQLAWSEKNPKYSFPIKYIIKWQIKSSDPTTRIGIDRLPKLLSHYKPKHKGIEKDYEADGKSHLMLERAKEN